MKFTFLLFFIPSFVLADITETFKFCKNKELVFIVEYDEIDQIEISNPENYKSKLLSENFLVISPDFESKRSSSIDVMLKKGDIFTFEEKKCDNATFIYINKKSKITYSLPK